MTCAAATVRAYNTQSRLSRTATSGCLEASHGVTSHWGMFARRARPASGRPKKIRPTGVSMTNALTLNIVADEVLTRASAIEVGSPEPLDPRSAQAAITVRGQRTHVLLADGGRTAALRPRKRRPATERPARTGHQRAAVGGRGAAGRSRRGPVPGERYADRPALRSAGGKHGSTRDRRAPCDPRSR
jgi:hypothetical protein